MKFGFILMNILMAESVLVSSLIFDGDNGKFVGNKNDIVTGFIEGEVVKAEFVGSEVVTIETAVKEVANSKVVVNENINSDAQIDELYDSMDDADETFTLSGTIYDLKGNEAIVGAIVEIDGKSTFSDLWGNYMITGVSRGLQKLRVRYLSYKPKEIELEILDSRKLDIDVERMDK